jgi:hypothetical protein
VNFLLKLSDWIVSTPVSRFLQELHGMVQVSQIIHLVAISVLLSAATIVNLRLLGLIRSRRPVDAVLNRFVPALWIALGVLAVTGGLLLTVEPGRSLTTGQFQIKMACLLTVIVLTLVMQRQIRVHSAQWGPGDTAPAAVKIGAVVCMALWLAIIIAGRWIAYA